MQNLLRWAGAIALALLPALASAQSPNVGKNAVLPAGYAPGTVIYCDDGTGHVALCSFGSGGVGGGGDASAANQAQQLAAEQAIRDRIGAVTSPAAGTTNYILTDLRSLLGGTLTVGTHGVTQSGAWTVSLGTLNGAATSAKQDLLLSALGTPLQAGGTIGNAAFGARLQDASGAAIGTAANPVIVDSLYRGAAVDRGGVFGTSAATLMAANASRRGFSAQVQGTSGSCYINGAATATPDYHSLQIPAGNLYETPDNYSGTGAISIVCTTANTSVYARER